MTEPIVDWFPLPATTRAVPRTGSRSFGAPRDGGARLHAGVDLFAPAGTPIESPVDGTVVATLDDARRNCGFGVVIRSSDGYLWTLCHFAAVPLFERGEHVEAGDVVGHVGNTGNARNGAPHLHLHALDADRRPVDITNALADVLERDRTGARRPTSVVERPRTTEPTASRAGLGVLALVGVGLYVASKRKKRGNVE